MYNRACMASQCPCVDHRHSGIWWHLRAQWPRRRATRLRADLVHMTHFTSISWLYGVAPPLLLRPTRRRPQPRAAVAGSMHADDSTVSNILPHPVPPYSYRFRNNGTDISTGPCRKRDAFGHRRMVE